MIELSNTTAQTIAPGQTLTFDSVLLKGGFAEAHRTNSGIITLKCKCSIYEVHFAANIAGTAAGPIQLSIELDGEPLAETTMIATPTVAADATNVATATLIRTDSNCCGRVTVVNTGSSDVIVSPNPALFVKRVA